MTPVSSSAAPVDAEGEAGLLRALRDVMLQWRLIVGGALLSGACAAVVALLLPAVYTGRTTLLPPQHNQSLASLAINQLGVLGALAGAATGLKSPVDQFVGLLHSETVADRVIDALELMAVYDVEYRQDARKRLARATQITVGRRDGLIVIEVEDRDAARAAAIANRYVDELRRLSNELALTEAQQRRRFFDIQLEQVRRRLDQAQTALQASGFNLGTLRAEPRAAAESYARLRAQAEAAELRLGALRMTLADTTPEVRQQLDIVAGLRARLAQAERQAPSVGVDDGAYLSAYRELKYQEALFELFARQFELARVDEAREGTLVQVVDAARPAERRTRPKRVQWVLLAIAGAAALLTLFALLRREWKRAAPPRPAQVA